MCIRDSTYTHTHTCMYTCTQAGRHTYACVHTHTCTHTHMHAGRQAHRCTRMHARTHTCAFTHMHAHAHICTHMHAHIQTHTHTHTVQTDRGEGQCCLTEILLSICRICSMEGEGLETESRGKHTSGLRLIYLSNAVKHNEEQCFSSCR